MSDIVELCLEATTVLDEPFHHPAIAETLQKAAAEITALRKERDEMREALEPFAKEAETEGNIRLSLGPDIDHWPIGPNSLTLGDLRRARNACHTAACPSSEPSQRSATVPGIVPSE